MSERITNTIGAWRQANPPSWLLGLVVVAVLFLPGGIPMTVLGLPVYLRYCRNNNR